MIGVALRQYLGEIGPLADLVGGRIFPVIAPQQGGDLPRVRTIRVSDVRERCLDYPNNCPQNGTAKYVLACEGELYAEAQAIEEAIRWGGGPQLGLDGFLAFVGPTGAHYQVNARIDDARETADPPVHGDDAWVVRIELDLTLMYTLVG